MGKLVNSAILNEIKSLYPYLDIRPLTSQQEILIHLLLEGSSISVASRGSGYVNNQTARNFLETEPAQVILKYFSDQEVETIRVTKESITQMYLELYGERANTAEGARVVEGLSRLHGLNEEARQKKTETNVTINQQNNTVLAGGADAATIRKKMEVMDEKQLIQRAGPRFIGIDLDPELIEATPITIKDDHAVIDVQRERPNKVLVRRTEEGEGASVLHSDPDSGGD